MALAQVEKKPELAETGGVKGLVRDLATSVNKYALPLILPHLFLEAS